MLQCRMGTTAHCTQTFMLLLLTLQLSGVQCACVFTKCLYFNFIMYWKLTEGCSLVRNLKIQFPLYRTLAEL